jgi:hypothetical protein
MDNYDKEMENNLIGTIREKEAADKMLLRVEMLIVAVCIGFMLALLLICLMPFEDEAIMTRLVMNLMTAGVAVLAYIIYRTEQVYWYNGTEYEEAIQAGSERRREFARRHLVRFANAAGLFLAFSLISYLLKLPIWVDIVVGCIGIMAAAFSTMKIKL